MFGSKKRQAERKQRESEQALEIGRSGTPDEYKAAYDAAAARRDKDGYCEATHIQKALYAGAIKAFNEGRPANAQLIMAAPADYRLGYAHADKHLRSEILYNIISAQESLEDGTVQTLFARLPADERQEALDYTLMRSMARSKGGETERLVAALIADGANPAATTLDNGPGEILGDAIHSNQTENVIRQLLDGGATFRDALSYAQAHQWKPEQIQRIKDVNNEMGSEPITPEARIEKTLGQMMEMIQDLTAKVDRLEAAQNTAVRAPETQTPRNPAAAPTQMNYKKVLGGP